MDNDEGFQSEPEVILIDARANEENDNGTNENSNGEIISEENDENEAPSNEQNNREDDDETAGCPICLEPWTNSGRHRLCSLRCGHLFGRQCVDRWLAADRTKCPQCNAPAKRSDIRVLYCKKLMSMDTTERDRLEAQLEAQRFECRRLEEALAQANLASQIIRAELETLKGENGRLKKRKFPEYNGNDNNAARRSPLKFLRRAILGQGTTFQCRTVAFDPHYGIFLVSRSDGEHVGGIVKVSLWDPSGSEFVALHEGSIRAIASSPHGDGLFLTCGSDELLKLSTMSSNSVLQSWKLSASPWSCAFHPGSINHVLVGLSNGQIAIFDLRQPTSTPPHIISVPRKTNLPVHSVHVIKAGLSDDFIVVAATMEGPFAIKLSDSEDELVTWSSNFGYKNFTCNSLSLDPANRKSFLASYRSVPPREPSRHLVFEFSEETAELQLKLPFSEFKNASDGPNKIPFRSSLISSSSPSSIECFIPDEVNFTSQCYQLSPSSTNYTISSQLSPSEMLSTNAGIPIIETCAGLVGKSAATGQEISINDANSDSRGETLVIGILTSKNLYIYTS